MSVGYRVNSSKAINFRMWANSVLKQHITKGYTINQARLQYLGKTLEIFARSIDEMVSSVASLIEDFTSGIDLLDNYDHNTFTKPEADDANAELTYEKAREFIDAMKFGSISHLANLRKRTPCACS